jgi:hypothetical protein
MQLWMGQGDIPAGTIHEEDTPVDVNLDAEPSVVIVHDREGWGVLRWPGHNLGERSRRLDDGDGFMVDQESFTVEIEEETTDE